MNVRLDDLASPRFSAEGQQILDMMATMAPECPLDAGALHAKASADTGLHDFGPIDYRERLEVYLAALREIDGLHDAGVVNFYGQLLQVLKNRLLLTDLLSRHPEINGHRVALARGHCRATPHRHHTPAQHAGRAADLSYHAVLGKQRAVPDAE